MFLRSWSYYRLVGCRECDTICYRPRNVQLELCGKHRLPQEWNWGGSKQTLRPLKDLENIQLPIEQKPSPHRSTSRANIEAWNIETSNNIITVTLRSWVVIWCWITGRSIITIKRLHKIIRTHSSFKTRDTITPWTELNTGNERKSSQNWDCKKRLMSPLEKKNHPILGNGRINCYLCIVFLLSVCTKEGRWAWKWGNSFLVQLSAIGPAIYESLSVVTMPQFFSWNMP